MEPVFDHEKLVAYQESLCFCGWVGDLLASLSGRSAVKDQLDRASTSIPLNIAEGNGKLSDADRARFLETSRGSTLECAAWLDVMVVRKMILAESIHAEKQRLGRIAAMLLGLLRRFSPRGEVLREDTPVLDQDQDQDREQEGIAR
jgi:four helix bundle protein